MVNMSNDGEIPYIRDRDLETENNPEYDNSTENFFKLKFSSSFRAKKPWRDGPGQLWRRIRGCRGQQPGRTL